MHEAIERMLSKYRCQTLQEYDRAFREVLQEISLVGLWRSKFFEHAAFYGGTALRILYRLDRFSEDLDFTTLNKNSEWDWHPYGEALKTELTSYGFEVAFEKKEKESQTPIKSAFLKTPTLQEFLKIGVPKNMVKGMHPESLIRIKIEIDTEPTIVFPCEHKFLVEPLPISIKCVDQPSLFAGKMHAALFRAWKGRVKGRDWYDIVWFIRRNIPLNLKLFSAIAQKDEITPQQFLKMAKERIENLDVESAKKDILNFVYDTEAIERTWSKEFFLYWLDQLIFE